MKRYLAILLRAVGRRCFALADRVHRDELARVLDAWYSRGGLQGVTRELRGISAQLHELGSPASRQIAREIDALQPRSTPYTRKLRRVE